MILQFSDKNIEVREEYLKTTISKSTGKELNNYQFNIKVTGKEKFEELKKEIEKYKEEILKEVDSNGNVIREFNIGKWSYRFFSEFDVEDTSYLCNIEIVQVEKIYTNNIIIAGIENEVLKYKEEYDRYNDAIIIHAVIKNTEEQRNKMNDVIGDKEYFEVIRPDINDKSLEMRFGKVFWSKHDDYIKRSITLVEKKYDEKDRHQKPLFWPELPNMRIMLSKNIAYTKELEKILINKNLVTQEEINTIKENIEQTYKEIHREIYLVEDAENTEL